jgi:hypothetical protein
VKRLRDDLGRELAPIVKVAEEALRQSSAAFKAIDELRADTRAHAGKIERLDERTSFLRNTNRFRVPSTEAQLFKDGEE